MREVFIYDAVRSPRGKAKESGGLHDLTPHELLARLYTALEQRTGLETSRVGDIVLGCVTQAGEQAGNIAKTSALYAGWPDSVGGVTVNRFCSSGLDAINFAALKIAAGQEEATVAGGVEMMSRVPMLSDRASVFSDPAYAARCRMLLMGSGADLIASLNGVTREQADQVALLSQQRAAQALHEGRFRSVIAIENAVKGIIVTADECVRGETTLESLAALPPAFADIGEQGADAIQLARHTGLETIDHIHTAGNSPAMADAAALLLLGSDIFGVALGVKPRGRVLAATVAADDPLQVLSGCVAATHKLMREQRLSGDDIDLYEIHEAFAATMVKAERDLEIPFDRVNVNGGVIALGHPMGATGGILTLTLLDELERRQGRLGVVAASGAGGSGSAMLIERVD
ncbi:MAG: acetyl-CoA C-acetyltransferase [Halioglobus sp.]